MQVGQTGKLLLWLYIAVGISAQSSIWRVCQTVKSLFAINKEAPISKLADYGLVADLFEALPELEKEALITPSEKSKADKRWFIVANVCRLFLLLLTIRAAGNNVGISIFLHESPFPNSFQNLVYNT